MRASNSRSRLPTPPGTARDHSLHRRLLLLLLLQLVHLLLVVHLPARQAVASGGGEC